MEIFATIFAGLGFFFIGLKLFGNSFKKNSSRQFHHLIEVASQRRGATALLGTLAGAFTQSATAVTFIVISMTSAGLMKIRRGIPIIAWANVGTTALVLIATLDIHLAIYLLIGMVGLGYYFKLDEHDAFRTLLGALFGFSLLLLGLWMVKSGAGGLRDSLLVQEILSYASGYLLLAFLVGAVLSIITQSSSTVSAIAVTFVAADLLTLDQALLILLGASIGSGISTFLIGRRLSGTAMQIILIQCWGKSIGALLLLALTLLEIYAGVPGLKAIMALLSGDSLYQLAWAALLIQLATVTILHLFTPQLLALARQLSPKDPEEELARPLYLFDLALDDSESALDLVAKEHSRLLCRLPMYLDPIRPDAADTSPLPVATLHPASQAVGVACGDFLGDLIGRTQAQSSLKRVVNMQSRNDLLLHLLNDCKELYSLLAVDAPEQSAHRLRGQLIEGLHALLLMLADTRDDTPDELEFLLIMSGDRSSLMEQMRSKLLANDEKLSADSQRRLFAATTLLERLTWMIHSYAQLLARSERGQSQSVAVEATA